MFKTTVFLQQHTPIIHFQHEQEGATLRATEVRAKLDKFLIEKKGGWKAIPTNWKVGKGKPGQEALDYKLWIEPNGEPVIDDIDKRFPGFFANMGNDQSNIKKFSMVKDGLALNLFSFDKKLIEFAKENIHDFFALNNFGTRQTKGFGCFMTKDNTLALSKHYPYSFTVRSLDIRTVFETIDLFYKSLRGGINGASIPGSRGFTKRFYLKPMIFLYAASNGIEWEKKAIKNAFPNFRGKLDNQRQNHGRDMSEEEEKENPLFFSGKQRIVRDLLGLSTEQAWKGYGRDRNDDASVTKKHCNEQGREIREGDAIARFKSPLLFKPILNNSGKSFTVYFRPEPIPQEFLEAHFSIEEGRNKLPLPVWREFGLAVFLSFAFQEGRLENAIKIDRSQDYDRRSSREIETAEKIGDELTRIYQEIRQSR